MAGADWSYLVLDEKGQRTDLFTSPMGVRVRFKKNWIYVADPKAWRQGSPFVEPVVARVLEGKLNYLDVEIHAVRGPFSGIYGVAYTRVEDHLIGLVGYGVFGENVPGAAAHLSDWLTNADFDLPEELLNQDLLKALTW